MPLVIPLTKLLLPADVVIIPVLAVTLRMRLFHVSAMKMLPDASSATPLGAPSEVLVAATLSETYPH